MRCDGQLDPGTLYPCKALLVAPSPGTLCIFTRPISPMPPGLCYGSKREIGIMDHQYPDFKCHIVSETEEGAGQTRQGEGNVFFVAEPSSSSAGLLSGAPGFPSRFVELGVQPQAWHVLGRCSTTELHLRLTTDAWWLLSCECPWEDTWGEGVVQHEGGADCLSLVTSLLRSLHTGPGPC